MKRVGILVGREQTFPESIIKSINELGFKDISLDMAQELRNHGVSAAFIKKMKGKGLPLHTLDDYIKLRDTGFSERDN